MRPVPHEARSLQSPLQPAASQKPMSLVAAMQTVTGVARQAAPAAVARGEEFYKCPRCGRVYWEGGHTRRMRRVVEEVFGRGAEGAACWGRAPRVDRSG